MVRNRERGENPRTLQCLDEKKRKTEKERDRVGERDMVRNRERGKNLLTLQCLDKKRGRQSKRERQ